MRPEPYADRHRVSARAKADRRTAPTRTRDLLRWARREYELDGPPLAIHEGYEHIGDDGAPKIAGGFLHYVTSHPAATDVNGSYNWPMRWAIVRLQERDPMWGGIALDLCLAVYEEHHVIDRHLPGATRFVQDRLIRAVLLDLWAAWSPERIGPVKGKSESQSIAESAA